MPPLGAKSREFLSLCLLALGLWLLTPGLASSSQVRTLNLEQLTSHADRVFQGRCIQVRVATDPALGQTVTYVSFAPQGSAKGTLRGRLTIKLLGNQSESARPEQAIEGIPRFHEGEEVILFLYPDSSAGMTSPVGFGQGKFTVVRDRAGRARAINQFGNERLLDELTPAGKGKLGARVEIYRGRGGISPDALLEMVRALE